MEASELVAEALGEHVFDFFLRNKRTEWSNYRSHVTPYELKTYLSLWSDRKRGEAGRSRSRPSL